MCMGSQGEIAFWNSLGFQAQIGRFAFEVLYSEAECQKTIFQEEIHIGECPIKPSEGGKNSP